MEFVKWPKIFPPLTPEQQIISNDFMKHWHITLASRSRYGLLEKFNHGYAVKHAPKNFLHTLEIGAGIGEHICYEKLSPEQKKHYCALELRENMAAEIKKNYPEINVQVGDCQQTLSFADNHFDRILAIHVLEHLPHLPNAIKEMYRLCNKQKGIFSIVIPCEGGWAYTLARKISAQKIFEHRYKQPYQWFIEREHINVPHEILEELKPYFEIIHRSYFPLLFPFLNFNLCIGMTLRPRSPQC
ncbi:MAG: class I SAM-dependent methyltransferase [Gammaproteobacteria bacterium]|nr:class I SAM-dependent methyltransferase [Gammaproteobacteria bacterium]